MKERKEKPVWIKRRKKKMKTIKKQTQQPSTTLQTVYGPTKQINEKKKPKYVLKMWSERNVENHYKMYK